MMQRELARPIEVLLVEDNAGDIRLTKEAFDEGKVRLNLSVARDGVEAMAFLRKEGSFARTAYPDLVLLDLNLPKKDGREVLREMKNDPQLLRIPVVVLTTSGSDEDILGSYGLHANCYITKPVDMDQFVKVVKVLEEFWFVVAKIPDGRNA
jgi:two-component system, chemotaxis family, response regulator Rcp1